MNRSRKTKYLSLDHTRPEIRMLALLGSTRTSAPIKGKLVHVFLDDLAIAPFGFYEALSYTWGDLTDTIPCKINGLDHQITRNLDAALRVLRGYVRPRYIWVDAICINQEDIVERASQVQLMRGVFRHAEQVLVWLGPPADDAPRALNFLDSIFDKEDPEDFITQSLVQSEYLSQWQAVAKFFDRPWFRRCWVRQEVACAKETMILCGREDRLKMQWDTMIAICEGIMRNMGYFELIHNQFSSYSSGVRRMISMDTDREAIQRGDHVDLETLLFRFRGTEASDPRDRVYGLLGLAGSEGAKIEVDYSLSSQAVFKNTTMTLLNQRQSLNPLSGCQWSNTDKRIPSWVLQLDLDFAPMVLRCREEGEDLYHAAGSSKSSFTFDKDELIAEGYILDVLCEVENFADGIAPLDMVSLLDRWLKLLRRSAQRQTREMTELEVLTAFCRTVIADQDDEGDRAPAQFYDSFIADSNFDTIASKLGDNYEKEANLFAVRMQDTCVDRVMIGSSEGYFGLAGASCLPGDLICLLLGAGVPFILRPDGAEFILIGEAYVHGIMDGEAFDDLQAQNANSVTFRIK